MNRSDANISGCNFGEDAVLYLYGELPNADRVTFESHLVDCTACTDEFAAMASARYEVYEWKKLEFDPIPTPHFEVPFEQQLTEAPSESWTDRIRSAFGRGWAVPGVAFAGLAVISIFAAAFVLSGGPDEIASSTVPVETPADSSVIASPDIQPSTTTSPAEDRAAEPLSGEARLSVRPVVRSEGDETRRASVTPVARAERRSTARNASTAQAQRTVTKSESTRAVKVDVPRLNEFPDDEDTSLRLAELFEDGETRD